MKGSTVVVSKKKHKTFVITSDEASVSIQLAIVLPQTYEDFVAESKNACNERNENSQKAILLNVLLLTWPLH